MRNAVLEPTQAANAAPRADEAVAEADRAFLPYPGGSGTRGHGPGDIGEGPPPSAAAGDRGRGRDASSCGGTPGHPTGEGNEARAAANEPRESPAPQLERAAVGLTLDGARPVARCRSRFAHTPNGLGTPEGLN